MASTTNIESPIFIVGIPRSGTTLVRTLITSHPSIAIAPETHFLNEFWNRALNGGCYDFEILWQRFTASERFSSLGLDASSLKQALLNSSDLSPANILRTVLKAFAERQGKTRWGEKTPAHYAFVDYLLEWYPQAFVIWVVRDPRAVCCSLLSVHWRRWNSEGIRSLEPNSLTRIRRIYHDAKIWQEHTRDLVDRWAGETRVIVLKYERLVRGPLNVLKELGLALDEEFNVNQLSSRQLDEVHSTPETDLGDRKEEWRRRHFQRAVQPISTDSIEKWKSELSGIEAAIVEDICSKGMAWLGYELEGEAVESHGTARIQLGKAWGRCYWQIQRMLRRTGKL